MNHTRPRLVGRLRAIGLLLVGITAQSCTASAQVTALKSSAGTATAAGEYRRLELDEVAGVTLDNGHVIVRGSRSTVSLDLPSQIDTGHVVRHWALVTEAHVDGQKALTFTHDESLHDFTIELPESDGEVRYGGFAGRDGSDVLVFAWGTGGRCYWGYVAISRPGSSPTGR